MAYEVKSLEQQALNEYRALFVVRQNWSDLVLKGVASYLKPYVESDLPDVQKKHPLIDGYVHNLLKGLVNDYNEAKNKGEVSIDALRLINSVIVLYDSGGRLDN